LTNPNLKNAKIELETEPTVEPVADIDPVINVEALRIPLDFETISVKKLLLTVLIRRPKRQYFIRVCADASYWIPVAVIEMDDESEVYAVSPALVEVLGDDVKRVRLYLTIERGGTVFFWPIALPGSDGRRSSWAQSAQEAAMQAVKQWVRVKANRSGGCYDVDAAAAEIPEPEWPDKTPDELVALAFKGKFINSVDHPIVRRLRGLT
jgi:hypothetical protein